MPEFENYSKLFLTVFAFQELISNKILKFKNLLSDQSPQEWPENTPDNSWLVFNSIDFESFFTDGKMDVDEPHEKDLIEEIPKKHKVPALIGFGQIPDFQ